LTAAKKAAKAVEHEFVSKLAAARAGLSAGQEEALVLAVAHSGLGDHLDAYIVRDRQRVVAALESLWDKYATPLNALEGHRDASRTSLYGFLQELGYG
jgi:hypothetical protein